MNPLVTIVTITYNSAKFVRSAIESVLSQSFTDFEYLISDDNSTDNTWSIIKEYSDPRIKAWKNPKNLGEYPNRNKTLCKAKGKYILWIDGDDILYPHGLEFMVKMLEAFPNSAMACARPYWKNMIYPYELSPQETFKFDYLGSPVTINGFPDTLIKTKILIDLGGLPENYISGDTYIKKKIAMYHKILLVSNGVSWWRMPAGQASAKIRGTLQGLQERRNLNKYFLNHPDCPLSKEAKKIAVNNIDASYFRYLIRHQLFKGKIKTFLAEVKNTDLAIEEIVRLSLTRLKVGYTMGSSSENPLREDIKSNPFAKKY